MLGSHVLTAATWGRWQAKLAADRAGPRSPYLAKILSTHWLRTLLITLYALVLLGWAAAGVAAWETWCWRETDRQAALRMYLRTDDSVSKRSVIVATLARGPAQRIHERCSRSNAPVHRLSVSL
jgi:hypothetical protein